MLAPMIAGIRSVHFVGIGGIAMASVAAAMRARGFLVTGSDQGVYRPASDVLGAAGIVPRIGYTAANLEPRPDLVVIGNAISRGNPEAEEVLARRDRYCSLPELLREFFIRGKRSLVVCGTHGKTTTTSLLAWVFESSGRTPSFLIGGVPRNFPVGARFTSSDWIVLEGDEYDTAFFDKRSKFVHYQPEVAILNNLEYDHADIFENVAAIQKSFSHLIRLVPRNGLVLANGDDQQLAPLLDVPFCPVVRFGLGEGNAVAGRILTLGPGHSEFEVGGDTFRIGLAGRFNVMNALAVLACARHCGIPDDQIRRAFATFEGVQRRMEVRGEVGGVTVVDDFAHHPTAIRETLAALRLKFPGRRLWALFEPRSNTTRRRVFQRELATALTGADHVIVAQVAALERLRPEERLDPELLIRDVRVAGRLAEYLPEVKEIVAFVAERAREGDVVAVLSNGGFGGIHERLTEALCSRCPVLSSGAPSGCG
jgi:UDP-N-acetylmuramate: L-alanyl-gamma-D-glutamyl-meso-diaminopimelate ligase